MTYKGFEIKKVSYQDTICWSVPALNAKDGSNDIASSLKLAKKWIDMYLYDLYIGNTLSVFSGMKI